MSQIERLLKRARKADTEAANELLRMSYEDVYSYLRRLSGSQADAEGFIRLQGLRLKIRSMVEGS